MTAEKLNSPSQAPSQRLLSPCLLVLWLVVLSIFLYIEDPGLSGAPERASLITGTEHHSVLLKELVLFVEDKVPAAGEAEHVGHVARALDNVCVDVLQIAITTIALEIYSPDVIIGFIQISKKRFRNLKMLKMFLL